MAPPRKFDHDLAQHLYNSGIGVRQIAKHFGVTEASVYRVVTEAGRAMTRRYVEKQRGAASCIACGAPVNAAAARHGSGRCRSCASRRGGTSVRPDTLLCTKCQRWLPDDAFHQSGYNIYRRNRRSYCKSCDHAARRVARQLESARTQYYHRLDEKGTPDA